MLNAVLFCVYDRFDARAYVDYSPHACWLTHMPWHLHLDSKQIGMLVCSVSAGIN